MNFSNNLRTQRKIKGFTQETTSQLIGVKSKTYAAWEEGRSKPGLTYLLKICEVLEIDDLYLFIAKEINLAKV